MANFKLEEYETVDQRIRRFYDDHPDGRIITRNLTTEDDRGRAQWVIYALVYFSAGDQAADLPRASGLAFEIDGGGGANRMAALENAETSAIGRALANAGYSGDKRASAEEMAKANRSVEAKVAPDGWRGLIADATTVDELKAIHADAVAGGWATPEVMSALGARKKAI